MTKLYVPMRHEDDWRKLLADPERHWRPGYSAHAAAQAWMAADGLPPEVARILGSDAHLLLAIPEHKVAMPGRGRESQCDVFALVRVAHQTIAVAVEGKVDEPFGPTIGEWLAAPSDGKSVRLATICDLLGISHPPAPELRYQLFHRAAAAVLEARRFGTDAAALIVHSFSPQHRWFEAFTDFCAIYQVKPARNEAARVTLPDGRPLVLGWASGKTF